VDDLVDEAAMDEVLACVDAEPVSLRRAEIYAFEASDVEPQTAEFQRLRDCLREHLAPVLASLVRKPLSRVDMRGYAYREGHYLLPHTDHQENVGRAIAYAYYLPSPEPPEGGELELFACTAEGEALAAITPAVTIVPRANRLVVFEVSQVSLHRVHEVRRGLRASLAGWFYP